MKWTILALTILACAAFAAGAQANQQSMYFNLGLAWAEPDYPDGVSELMDLLEEVPGVDRYRAGVDLGLYFPVAKSSLLGPTLNGIGDRLDDGDDHFQLNQYLFGASFRHYLSGRIGEGLFLRADAGMARMALDASGMDTETSDWGTGFLFGGGFSFKIGGSTWFSISAEYTTKSIEDETVGGTTIGGAFLF